MIQKRSLHLWACQERNSLRHKPMCQCANELPPHYWQTFQGNFQCPPWAHRCGTLNQVPRGPLFQRSQHPPPPLQAYGSPDTRYQPSYPPQTATLAHLNDPHEQHPIPVFVHSMTHAASSASYNKLGEPEYLSPDAAIPPHHRPAQPFIPPHFQHHHPAPRETFHNWEPRLNDPFVVEQYPAHQPGPPHPVFPRSSGLEPTDWRQGFARFVGEQPPMSQHSSQTANVRSTEAEPIPTILRDDLEGMYTDSIPTTTLPNIPGAPPQQMPTSEFSAANSAPNVTRVSPTSMNAPRPVYPTAETLHDAGSQSRLPVPDVEELVEPARTGTSQGSGHSLSTETIEEIFTRGAAPVPEGQEFPGDQSPPPRPTMPPWELVDERSTLGLQDGGVGESIAGNDVPFTTAKRSPQHAHTMDTLSSVNNIITQTSGTSTVSNMVLLELPDVHPSDTPSRRKAREEMREFLRAASVSPENIGLHTTPSFSPPESQHPDDTEDPFRPSSNRMNFCVRRRQSTGSATNSVCINIIPPTTVASSANSLHVLSPETSAPLYTPFSPPTAHALDETHEEPPEDCPPNMPKSVLTQSTPLSTQAEAQTSSRARYLTRETLQRSPRARPPLFTTNNSEAGPSHFGTPAEQVKHGHLFHSSSRGKSSAMETVSPSEGTYVGRPWSRGVHSVEATLSGKKGGNTAIETPPLGTAPLVTSPEQTPDVFTVKQNLRKTGAEKETQPAQRPLVNIAPPENLFLHGSEEHPPATPEEHLERAAKETSRSRQADEADGFEAILRFNLGVLARQCLLEAESMGMAFAECNTLSSEALDCARSAYMSLSMALTDALDPLNREVDMDIDLSDDHQLSWRDQYEGAVGAMQRAMNRVSGLLNEFPRGDRVRRHLASVSAVAKRLTYITRKLEDTMDRIIYLRLSSQLKANNAAIRKAKITEEARRETYKAFSDRRKIETEGIRQRMEQLKAQRRAPLSDAGSEESGLESTED
ncbi:hypothetical protein BS17DRAFT_186477 [Gyrodon lividus]|nr:hypothetical protein BS17DRAFT_186477 [Gyrodon lividus]